VEYELLNNLPGSVVRNGGHFDSKASLISFADNEAAKTKLGLKPRMRKSATPSNGGKSSDAGLPLSRNEHHGEGTTRLLGFLGHGNGRTTFGNDPALLFQIQRHVPRRPILHGKTDRSVHD
jgi:hypothetical protein